ncbi:MAG: metallophosphoesterase [Burkholderiaceae bacterium]|nr:metallophosphoesterase [Burkholderiaceae bacterium]
MKIQILSDLHLTVAPMEVPRTAADVAVLAGDIARPRQAIEWALGFPQPVVYVPGNHEYYGGALSAVAAELRALARGTHVHVLDEDALELGGVRFVGATLWTDFLLFDDPRACEEASAAATRLIADFKRIAVEAGEPFTPEHSRLLCRRAAGWLSQQLAKRVRPTVVVTHHAPSARSVEPKYAGSPLNAAFVSNLDALVERSGADLWIHGHTHYPVDYAIGATRVFSNPRGYARDGMPENARFDPYCVVEIPA